MPVLWPEFSRWHLYAGLLHYQMNVPAVQVGLSSSVFNRCVFHFYFFNFFIQPLCLFVSYKYKSLMLHKRHLTTKKFPDKQQNSLTFQSKQNSLTFPESDG